MTPSQFAATVGGSRRNAWRDLWLRLPASLNWRKAAFLRDPMPLARQPIEPTFDPIPATHSHNAMATSLKNALTLIEKAAEHRRGKMDRRTDILPDE